MNDTTDILRRETDGSRNRRLLSHTFTMEKVDTKVSLNKQLKKVEHIDLPKQKESRQVIWKA